MLKSTNAEEQKWLIRILLKDVKLGLSENVIFKCYHPDARELYDSSNSLRKTCDLLNDPEIRLNEIQIQLFTPFKPMLSEECDIQKIDYYLKRSCHFFIETKLDGERFQLHFEEGNFKYFSRFYIFFLNSLLNLRKKFFGNKYLILLCRNGYDFTTNFGSSKREGNLSPRIFKRIPPHVKSCVLDGEMMSWDRITRSFSSKGFHLDRKSVV